MEIRGDFSTIPVIDLSTVNDEQAERELAPTIGDSSNLPLTASIVVLP